MIGSDLCGAIEVILQTRGWRHVSIDNSRRANISVGWRDWGPPGWEVSLALPKKNQLQAVKDFPSVEAGPLEFLCWQRKYAAKRAVASASVTVALQRLRDGRAFTWLGPGPHLSGSHFLPLDNRFVDTNLKLMLSEVRTQWVGCALNSVDGRHFLHICRRDEVDALPPGHERINIYNPRVAAQYGQLTLPFLEKVRREIAEEG